MVDILLIAYAVLTYPTGVLLIRAIMDDVGGTSRWYDWPFVLGWPVTIPAAVVYYVVAAVI